MCLWIVGVINAVNLIDGLDGLAGGVALLAATTNLVLALAQGNILLALMMAALAGALIGFQTSGRPDVADIATNEMFGSIAELKLSPRA